MGFRFKKKEDFKAGFARIAAEQIARALREWKKADRAIAVHETRKCLKRLRSLLQLVRPALIPQQYRDENANLREIARSLSVSRDRQVMLETIAFLTPDATPENALRLEQLQAKIAHDISNAPPGTAPNEKKTAKAIAEAGKRIAALEPKANGFDVVAAGFERTYRQGRERMAELAARYSDEASHDWRKRVQAHWRQLSLLAPAWPAFFQMRIALARQLSDALGHDHDLAVLGEYVRGPGAGVVDEDGVAAISNLIETRQEALRRQTLGDGMLLFADRPKPFTRLVRRYWDIAGDGQKALASPYRKVRPDRTPREMPSGDSDPTRDEATAGKSAKSATAAGGKKTSGKS